MASILLSRLFPPFLASLVTGLVTYAVVSRVPSGLAAVVLVLAAMAVLGVLASRSGSRAVGVATAGAWLGALLGAAFLPAPADEEAVLTDPVVLAVVAGTYLVLFAAPVLLAGWLAQRLRPRRDRPERNPREV